jgi:hypothetical protein
LVGISKCRLNGLDAFSHRNDEHFSAKSEDRLKLEL